MSSCRIKNKLLKLPNKCIIIFMHSSWTEADKKCLLQECKLNNLPIVFYEQKFIIFSETLLENFMNFISSQKKLDLKLVFSYLKLNNNLITIKNYYDMIQNFEKSSLYASIDSYLDYSNTGLIPELDYYFDFNSLFTHL